MTNWRPSYDWRNPGGSLSWLFGREYGMVEERGGIVQTDKGPRVELRRPDGSTALGHLSGSKDADLNPGAALAEHENSKRDAKEGELRRRYEEQAARQYGLQTRSLDIQSTQNSNLLQTTLAQLQQQGADSERRFQIQMKGLEDASRDRKDANELNRYSLDLSSANQSRALDLRGLEMQANIALQQEDLALRKEQIANMRSRDKTNAIMSAAQALLLPRG